MSSLVCPRCQRPLPASHNLRDQAVCCPTCREARSLVQRPQTVTLPPRQGTQPHREQTLPPASPGEAETLPPVAAADELATLAPAASATAGGNGRAAIAGYQIERELGRGGMGVVYQALDLRLKRRVALKMVLAGGHAGEAELARFRTEAEAVARLQHPNIVQIHEVGVHDGLPYFSLEFCPGGSLDRKLDGTPLPAREAAVLVEKLARAMQAAHDKGVIHRDLKPANVLLAEDGAPKVTDFGLARKLDEAGQTNTGSVMGTPSYMAPEQAGGSKHIGPACDVYALGAILYELLTGRPPFKAATPLDTVLQVVSDEPVPPSQLQSKTPKDLETIALKCLHKEPGKRYASAEELADELGRFLRGEPIRARPVGRLERAAKWVRRNKGLSAGLAAAVFALLLGTVVATWQAWAARTAASRETSQRQAAEEEKRAADKARQQAVDERERAKAEKKRAEDQLGRTELALYLGQLAQAQRERQDGNRARALEILQGCQWELRHFEHHYLWTHWNGSAHHRFQGHTNGATCVCFSPDGKRIASASFDGDVKVWDADKEQAVLTLMGHRGPVYGVCFSPDGQRLASASWDQTVKVWDASTGKQVLSLNRQEGSVKSVCFSPDGKRLASASAAMNQPGIITLWDADNGQPVLSLKGHTGEVLSVCFSPDGMRLASAGDDMTVRVWDLAARKQVLTLKEAPQPRSGMDAVTSVCFSPDGTRLASAGGVPGEPGGVTVWDVGTARKVLHLRGHTDKVLSVCFSPDGKRLASASAELKLWNTDMGQEVLSLKERVRSVCFRPDGKRLAAATGEYGKLGAVLVWDADKGQAPLSLKGHTAWVNSVSFSPDGRRLASASDDWTVRVWDASTGQEIFSLMEHTSKVRSVCYSPDGTRLATLSYDQIIKVWDAATGQQLLSFQDPTAAVNCLCFNADGTRLASAGRGPNGTGEVKVWDTATGREILNFKGHRGEVRSVCFSPDGKRLASAGGIEGEPGELNLWDATSGLQLLSLKGQTRMARSVCFSPDGKRLAAAGGEQNRGGELKVWDTDKGGIVLGLQPTMAVSSVHFSPDGKWLATAEESGLVKVWDADKGREVLSFKGHTHWASSVCFSPDGKRLASASYDKTVKVWDADRAPKGPSPRAD